MKEWVENNFQKEKLITSPTNQNTDVVEIHKVDGVNDKSQESSKKTHQVNSFKS